MRLHLTGAAGTQVIPKLVKVATKTTVEFLNRFPIARSASKGRELLSCECDNGRLSVHGLMLSRQEFLSTLS